MGNYNSLYEDYYNSTNRKKFNASKSRSVQGSKTQHKTSFAVRRIMQELIGVLILFAVVLSCKAVVNYQTKAAYTYSKSVVNTFYDYKPLYVSIRTLQISTIKGDILNYYNQVKTKLQGATTFKTKVTSEFIVPLKGTITSHFGNRVDPVLGGNEYHEGIDIDAKLNTDVKACFGGKIVDCGEESSLGKYIVIDHGDGIKSEYCHLNKIELKKDDVVTKGQVIAKSGSTGKSTAPHLHFELLYNGKDQDPEALLNFN